MTKRMLIDATHAEETRVAVVEGTRLVDFDYESTLRKQLKGSIFLAKVTRVEPSLQAAFVNFGGNRHGFLPFSEIHPDYFRIPIADREALIAAQQAEMEEMRAREEAEDEEEGAGGDDEHAGPSRPDDVSGGHEDDGEEDHDDMVDEIGGEDSVAREEDGDEDRAEMAADLASEEQDEGRFDSAEAGMDSGDAADEGALPDADDYMISESEYAGDGNGPSGTGNEREQGMEDSDGNRRDGGRHRGGRRGGRYRGRGRGGRGSMQARSRRFEKYADDEDGGPRMPGRRNYKIQEVIKRGQIMLVQASREERGNKGAAVTTYLSLPGRYCVLMPNSQRAGGVSRKVASFEERRRMREMLSEMTVPGGMSVIMRTAGVSRTKPEIRRDLDYLLKLWDGIRELTLQSTAPALVHEEGQLIRRAIRDLYGRDIEDIQVAGEEGYKLAKEYMRMMIPSHVKRVELYNDDKIPLFHRYQVENQIAGMGEPTVTLRSGGYLVINPTEALVSIDVNSGRATRERHIEETALKTNLEAAEEVARQLRLRDLGGLIVIDFIDMEDRRNNRRVENRLREALSVDRARIQVGRISSFGLLELSRQRLNPSLTEAQFEKCPHCKGVGYVRTVDMTAIMALRALENEGIRARAVEVALNVPDKVALYILNNKREIIADIERRYGFRVMIRNDETLAPAGFRVEPLRGADGQPVVISEEEKNESQQGGAHQHHHREEGRSDGQGGRRRRRGRRGGRGRDHDGDNMNAEGGDLPEREPQESRDSRDEDDSFGNRGPDSSDDAGEPGDDRGNRRDGGRGYQGDREDGFHDGNRRRRGRRGGRRRRGGRGGGNRFHDGAPQGGDSMRHEEGGPRFDDESQARPRREQPEPVAEQYSDPAPQPAQENAPPSNDVAPAQPPRDYERVNEPPVSKKKGWWNRLTE